MSIPFSFFSLPLPPHNLSENVMYQALGKLDIFALEILTVILLRYEDCVLNLWGWGGRRTVDCITVNLTLQPPIPRA